MALSAPNTHVKLLKKIDLPQQQRDRLHAGPGENHPNGIKWSNTALDEYRASFIPAEVARKFDYRGLSFPNSPKTQSQSKWKNVDRRA